MFTRIGMAMVVAAVLLVGSPALTQDKSGGMKLTGEELKKLFEPALLIAGSTVRGYSFAELYKDGTDAVAYRLLTDDTGFGDTRMEKGTWRFDGDKVCTTYPQASRPEEYCRYFHRLADSSYESRRPSDDTVFATFRIVNKK